MPSTATGHTSTARTEAVALELRVRRGKVRKTGQSRCRPQLSRLSRTGYRCHARGPCLFSGRPRCISWSRGESVVRTGREAAGLVAGRYRPSGVRLCPGPVLHDPKAPNQRFMR
jgi:hypothetical protein